MLAPIVRITLRYLSGFLLAKGIIDVSAADLLANDVDVQQVALAASEAVVGIATGVVTELWYRKAKKSGSAT
jgi:flagellar biosynthesis protein FliR